MFLSIGMLKQKYFLTDIFILSAEKQPIKLSWRKIEWLPPVFEDADKHVYHISWEDFVYIMEGVIRLNKHEYFDEVDEEEFDDEDVYEDENGDDFGESESYSV